MQCCAATAQSLHLTSVTGKTFFLEFACNLRSHCFGEGTRVEHFLNFGGFCSTLRAARAEFIGSGRTFFRFWRIFVLLSGLRGTILEPAVEQFPQFWYGILFYVSELRGTILEFSGRIFSQFFEILFYLQDRAP